MERNLICITAGILIVLAAGIIWLEEKKRRKKKRRQQAEREEMQRRLAAVEEQERKARQYLERASALIKDFQKKKEVPELLQCKEDLEAIRGFCGEKLVPAQLREFGLSEYLNTDWAADKTAKLKAAEKKVLCLESAVSQGAERKQAFGTEQNSGFQGDGTRKKTAEELLAEVEKSIRHYMETADEIRREIRLIDKQFDEVKNMLQTPITCMLKANYRNMTGVRACRKVSGYIEGYYLMDGLLFLDGAEYRSLKELLNGEETGIVVYGWKDFDGQEGLRLRGSKPFRVREEPGAGGNPAPSLSRASKPIQVCEELVAGGNPLLTISESSKLFQVCEEPDSDRRPLSFSSGSKPFRMREEPDSDRRPLSLSGDSESFIVRETPEERIVFQAYLHKGKTYWLYQDVLGSMRIQVK